MGTHRDYIDSLGGPHKLALLLTEMGHPTKEVTARAWYMRSSIPAKHWSPVIDVASDQGVPICAEDLLQAAAAKPAA